MTIFTWLVSGLSLVGLIYNVRGSDTSYLIWIPCNIALVGINYYYAMYAQMVLFTAYTVLSVYGYREWKKRRGCGTVFSKDN